MAVRKNTATGNIANKDSDITNPEMRIETPIFKDYIKQKFKAMITAIDPDNVDSKLLVMDRSFYDIFRLLFTKDEVGVGKITFLNEDLRTDSKHLIFLTPPSIQNMNSLSTIIKNNPNKGYYVIFSPKRTFGCKEALQMSGVYGSIISNDFNFDLIPLDYDFLSLEIPNASRLLYCDLDTTILTLVAESIHRLQLVFGRITTSMSKGYSAKTISEILKYSESESKLKVDDNPNGEIECLVVLDRNLDLVTPMLTQFTYAGSMDEIWSIKQNSVITLEKRFFPVNNVPRAEGVKEQDFIAHKLHNDKIFKEIRDYHIEAVPTILDEKLAEIKSIHDEIAPPTANKQDTIKDMAKNVQRERKILEKDFDKIATHVEVRKFIDEQRSKPSHFKLIKTEQAIVDNDIKVQEILDYIQTLIGKQTNINQVLKLLCLISQTENGIKTGPLEAIKRDIVLTYGFEHAITLYNLERAGLLKKEGEKKVWDTISKQLKLISPDFNDLKHPDDASFAYFGYCPILVRLVEQLFKRDGWVPIKNALDSLPGPLFYDERKANLFNDPNTKNTILVYIIGGVTYGEIAAFRYLSKKYNKEIIVASTAIITGDRLISGFAEKY